MATFYMMARQHTLVTRDAWNNLRSATPARIALGRAGGSLPTREWLDFKSAHAAARDAVHCAFDAEQLAAEIRARGVDVGDRRHRRRRPAHFLQRPDLGRRLDERSRYELQEVPRPQTAFDLAIIVSDGLSGVGGPPAGGSAVGLLLPRLRSDGWQSRPSSSLASAAWRCKMRSARCWGHSLR